MRDSKRRSSCGAKSSLRSSSLWVRGHLSLHSMLLPIPSKAFFCERYNTTSAILLVVLYASYSRFRTICSTELRRFEEKQIAKSQRGKSEAVPKCKVRNKTDTAICNQIPYNTMTRNWLPLTRPSHFPCGYIRGVSTLLGLVSKPADSSAKDGVKSNQKALKRPRREYKRPLTQRQVKHAPAPPYYEMRSRSGRRCSSVPSHSPRVQPECVQHFLHGGGRAV